MDTTKVKELIAELRREIEPKLDAIRVLEKLIAASPAQQLNINDAIRDNSVVVSGGTYYPGGPEAPGGSNESYVNLAIRIISANGYAPMAINDLVNRIRQVKGNPDIERRSVEATLYQHTKSENARLLKIGRGVYAIKRYPRVYYYPL